VPPLQVNRWATLRSRAFRDPRGGRRSYCRGRASPRL